MFRYLASPAKRTHSFTRCRPKPRPRAEGSTRSRRSCATSSVLRTRNTEPTRSPIRSAIQQGFPLGIVVADELSDDLGDERLERTVQSVLLCVQDAVTIDHPSHIACAVRPENEGRGFGCALAEQGFDALQRLDQVFPISGGKLPEFGAGFLVGSLVEGSELRSALRRERKDVLPPVCLGDIPRYQAALAKAGDDPADVAGVQAELFAELICRRVAEVRDFVEEAGFGERKRAVEKSVGQDADFLGIEAVEAADLFGVAVQVVDIYAIIIQLVAFVNLLGLIGNFHWCFWA